MTAKRKSKSQRSTILIILLLAVAAAVVLVPTGGQRADSTVEESATEEPTTTTANCSSDLLNVSEPESINSVLLHYTGFDVAFNPQMHQPNYVAWMLTASRTNGEASRKDVKFRVDDSVEGCATLDDYKNSGFDRGHMAPAADMKWSADAMADCHYLTNICPQNTKLNSGPWATVEKNCRDWAVKFDTIYIVAGPILTDKLTRSIGKTPVPVPERFFKVIIAPSANLGIAFLMPNSYIQGGAQSTVTSIDNIEELTGYDFFAALPDDIEDNLESQSNLAKWNY